jgi:hypothetical protein
MACGIPHMAKHIAPAIPITSSTILTFQGFHVSLLQIKILCASAMIQFAGLQFSQGLFSLNLLINFRELRLKGLKVCHFGFSCCYKPLYMRTLHEPYSRQVIF